jgi:cytidine deaminase
MTIQDLIGEAFKITGKYKPSDECTSGAVGAALITKAGNIYTGVSIECPCGIGFCAEHSAIAEMLKHRESEIEILVAVNRKKQILPPCGRCRELIYQINKANADTKIILNPKETTTLKALLPHHWLDILK